MRVMKVRSILIIKQGEIEGQREDDEEEGLMIESAPPLSIYYPPSSHSSFTKLVPTALPPKSLSVRSVLVGCADNRILLL
jgi:hypothetical protein